MLPELQSEISDLGKEPYDSLGFASKEELDAALRPLMEQAEKPLTFLPFWYHL